jgi:hypothetical protein
MTLSLKTFIIACFPNDDDAKMFITSSRCHMIFPYWIAPHSSVLSNHTFASHYQIYKPWRRYCNVCQNWKPSSFYPAHTQKLTLYILWLI